MVCLTASVSGLSFSAQELSPLAPGYPLYPLDGSAGFGEEVKRRTEWHHDRIINQGLQLNDSQFDSKLCIFVSYLCGKMFFY